MTPEIKSYNAAMPESHQPIADALAILIDANLKKFECKVWHRTAVWFIAGNPIVGYSSRKKGVQLMFWSGQSFGDTGLIASGSFKAAETHYNDLSEINASDINRWLMQATSIQWDYKNIVKRKGILEKIGNW